MIANIVIGPSWSGKYQFIKEHFPRYEILSVGKIQRDMQAQNPDMDFYRIVCNAHEQIIEEFIEKLSNGTPVVMAHTLYKSKRRIDYVKQIKEALDISVDIYVMQPSDQQILQNIAKDTERIGNLDAVKSNLRELEIPSIDEGFSHVYIINEKGIQDWSNKTQGKKVIDEFTTIELHEIDEKKESTSIQTFGDKPFKHICEVCGKIEILTFQEAFDQGWDYPGEEGLYKTSPKYGFGILSPRTCGGCSMVETAYWALVAEHKSLEQLSESQKQTVERIMQEPEVLRC